MTGTDATNSPHNLLLTDRQVTSLRKAFGNSSLKDTKLSKISKIIQSGGFLGRLLGPLLKASLPLMKNALKPLTKSVLIPLGVIAAASAPNKNTSNIK